MKKLISVIMLGAAVLALAGCGSSKKDSPQEATTEAKSMSSQIVPVEIDAGEYMELGEYKGLTVENSVTEVTEQEVDEQMEALALDYAEYKDITDRDVVQKKDYINMNYTCIIDGKANDNYTESDVDTRIGDEEYSIEGVYDLDKQLTGAKTGDTIEISFTFPEDYDDPDVAGKDCVMKVTVNSIQEEVLPEITDDFVKENTECNTVAEYREQLRQELQESYESEAEMDLQDELWSAIMSNSRQKKAFPKDIVEQEKKNQVIQNEEGASYFGMETEEFIEEYYGMNLDDYVKDVLKQRCVQDLLVEAEKLSVTDEEFKQEIQNYINDYGYEDEEEVMEYYTEEEIKSDMLYNKLMASLLNYANVVESTEAAE